MNDNNTGRRGELDLPLSLFDGERRFHTQDGQSWIQADIHGRRKVFNLSHDRFRSLFAARYFDRTHAIASKALTDGIVSYLHLEALANQEILETRVARPDRDNVFIHLLDLGDGVVHVHPTGWEILPASSTRFLELAGMLPLPVPDQKEALDPGAIATLVQQCFDLTLDSTQLILAWILATLSKTSPFPVLVLAGAAGSHKTTLGTWIKSMVDPCDSPEALLPEDGKDLGPSLSSSYIPLYGNVGRLSKEQAAYLCTASTGGGTRNREMYTDDSVKPITFTRPLILTAIENPAREPGLRSRSVLIELDHQGNSSHRSQHSVEQELAAYCPGMFSGLLTVLSSTLAALPSVRTNRLPRMADFARLGMAMAPAFGWDPEEWLEAYHRNIHGQSMDAVADSVIGTALVDVVTRELRTSPDGVFRITTANLLSRLITLTNPAFQNSLPQNAWALSHELDKVQVDLPAHGFTFSRQRAHGTRILVFERK